MAYDETIKAGSTSKVIEVMLRDSSTGAGKTGLTAASVVAYYCREGGNAAAIVLVAGSPGDAYSSGKWAEVDATNMRGIYQFHIPNAVLAAGVQAVTITLQAAGAIDARIRICLPAIDAYDAASAGLSLLDASVSSRNAVAPLDAAGTRTAIGLATANLDDQLVDIPTVAEFEARTILAADYATATALGVVDGNVDTLVARITAARAGYMDYLNVGGLVASQADIAGITQAQRVRIIAAPQMERPDTGSTAFRIWLYAYNEQHQAEDLDSIPTVTAENNAAVDRSANLGTVTKPAGTGVYYVDYTVADTHAVEGLIFKAACVEAGVTTNYAQASIVSDTTAVDFTATDRANLEAIVNKLPSKTYLAGTVNADGDIQMDEATGNFAGSVGSIDGISFPTNFAALAISAGGATDSFVQGILNTALTESSAGRIAGNMQVFWDNADALTTQTVDDVGAVVSGGDATAENQTTILTLLRGSGALATIVEAASQAATIIRGDSYIAGSENGCLEYTLPGILGSAITKIWFTVKKDSFDEDTDAVLQVTKDAGEIVITDTGTDAVIAVSLTAAQTAALKAQEYDYDIQVESGAGNIATPVIGKLTVSADVTLVYG